MLEVIDTEKVPIKLWLDNIEQGALEQAKHLANLPFVFKHIAIMPDSHQGYGMPIGGVMATKGAIVPNAVGVDIGCFDKETEYLTPAGWVKFDSYAGQNVMQFSPETNEGTFVKPLRYIKERCDRFIHIKTKYGIDQALSNEHRCLVYKYSRNNEFRKHDIILAKDLMEKHNRLSRGFRDRFLTCFHLSSTNKLNLSDIELRLTVMLSADGCINRGRIVLQFKKARKINRAEQLLRNANISYNKGLPKDGVTRISFPRSGLIKGLDNLWRANKDQLTIIADEVLYWDGNHKDKCFYTRNKKEADFVHYAMSAIGKRSVLRKDIHHIDGMVDYRVYQHDNIKIGINGTPKTKIRYMESTDGYKYSFTVPTSFLVTRRNGNIVVSGNCGMMAVKTYLTELSTDTLKSIMGRIRQVVPVGFNHHKEKQEHTLFPTSVLSLPVVDRKFDKSRYQLGTLGGGNHFIEIQKSADGYIWIMVHSGSRNLGKQVADHYNKLAILLNEKWHVGIPPTWDLAFLPLDSEEAKLYLSEMDYCVRFALANRKLMMDRIKGIFDDLTKTSFGTEINIAHNYARMESHCGHNVMVHRKGATSAKLNELGIIPGSQGTKSYIVAGKGNMESFQSCSHGAGRKMGRNQAQRTLNLQDEQRKLDELGILHAIRGVGDLDEASGAYKDIDEVMSNQSDLVTIIETLSPLGVIKG